MSSHTRDAAGGASKQHDRKLWADQYRRIQGSEAAAAVDFFEGETAAASPKYDGAILDLDAFFQRVYRFYADKGFKNLTIRWVAELVVVGFTIAFSGFLVLFVDWPRLLTAKCDWHLPGCDLVKEALREHPLRPLTPGKMFFVCYLALALLYWCFCFAKFFYQLQANLEIRHFVHTRLGISEKELQRMSWPSLVDKIVNWQRHDPRGCRVIPRLSAHAIASRIMRKENYLIGMLNKGVLAVHRPSGRTQPVVLTKVLEWSLDWCIFQFMFDSNFMIRGDFTSEPARLRRRLKVLGVVMLALSPFYLPFMVFYFVLWNVQSFYRNPAVRGLRGWSNWASWSFREFNELEHMFKHRLISSTEPALEYVKQFPSHATSTVAKVVSYIAGAFAALILLLYVIDPSLLEGHIGGHNLLWYEFLFGAIMACSRALIAEDSGQVFNPVAIMRQVSLHTHYMPKHWREAENVEIVRSEFRKMFKIKAVLFLEEILSIFVAPYILIFELPECVDNVLQFVQDFSVHVGGVGHVCSLSVFDFEQHGNSKYGSPFDASKRRRSSQGKMEKSFISFKTNYPNWEPNGGGKQLMCTLESSSRLQACDEENQGLVATAGPGIPRNNPRRPSFNASGNLRERDFVHVIEMPSSVNGSDYSYLQRPEDDAAAQMDLLDKFYTLESAQSPPQNHLRLAGDASFTFAGRSDTINKVPGTSVRDLETRDAAQAERTGTRWWDRQQDSRGSAGQSFLYPPSFDVHNLPDSLSSSDDSDGSGDEATWAPSQRGSDARGPPSDRAHVPVERGHQNLVATRNDGHVNVSNSPISNPFEKDAFVYTPFPMLAWLMAHRQPAEAGSQVLQQEQEEDDGDGNGDGGSAVLEFPFGDAFDRRT